MMRLFLVLFGFAGGAALIAVGLAVSATNVLGWPVAAVGAAYGLGQLPTDCSAKSATRKRMRAVRIRFRVADLPIRWKK